MKGIKKFLAIVLAVVMTLAMATTAFAGTEAPYNSNITVMNLSERESTTVNIYQVVSYDATANTWKVANWANDITKTDGNTKAVVLTDERDGTVGSCTIDWEALKNNIGTTQATATQVTSEIEEGKYGTSVTFSNQPVGAYLIIANGSKVTYSVMGANTYDTEQTYMASKDITVVAKPASYVIDKSADDHFVAKGQTVIFTVTTTFPTFDPAKEYTTNPYFKIIDTPEGLTITGTPTVKIGGEAIELASGTYGYDENNESAYVIDLSSQIGTKDSDTFNDNGGKTVVVTYTATVTSEGEIVESSNGEDTQYCAFVNSAVYHTNDFGSEPKVVAGYTGDITLTKYNEAGQKTEGQIPANVLSGAKFKVYHDTKNKVISARGTDSTEDDIPALYFVKDTSVTEKDVYILADSTTEDAVQELDSTTGIIQVKGLEEGKYWFEETKAPVGYSINENGVEQEITVDDTTVSDNISLSAALHDVKLSALPSTGGIGTTIFTIAGCIIMILAAALFFINRRRTVE